MPAIVSTGQISGYGQGGTYGIFGLDERVVDSHDLDIVVLDTGDIVRMEGFGHRERGRRLLTHF
jgi:hypothetical protein